ncbi:hypothetical protein TeGR_g8612 [Tetraparma gracilis]|uniref:Uncharacterized protein n=1 Tax=Tetraparma gracilis TaxID=2962635 RepID=A0ABQ6MCE0_9STRA|nr:hypothetical protein TeGR_g8612 [Tetraparma gracilis]
MIGIKSITAFYQSAQLTTLVSIPWPKIALWAPFTVPYGDANCLTNQVGWNQQLSFFVTLRTATIVHAIAVVAIVGVGLPLFIVRKMLQLRREDKLDVNSIYAGLFEW